jgi:hypothetical protein
MPIDEIIKGVARTTKKGVDVYKSSPKIKTTVNTVAIYGGTKVAGNILENYFPGADYIADIAAPILSGIYASKRINDETVVSSSNARVALKIGIAAFIGWDLSDTIIDYNGHIPAAQGIKYGYDKATELIQKYFEIGPRVTGVIIGAGVATAKRFKHHYNNPSNTETTTGADTNTTA